MKKQVFDFDEALKAVKAGQAITGKDGVLAPLVKQLTEAALEADVESHLDNKKVFSNRLVDSNVSNFELQSSNEDCMADKSQKTQYEPTLWSLLKRRNRKEDSTPSVLSDRDRMLWSVSMRTTRRGYALSYILLWLIFGFVECGVFAIMKPWEVSIFIAQNVNLVICFIWIKCSVFAIFSVGRFRDMDKSPWNALWTFIPFVSFALMFIKGTEGPNRYGPQPK